MIQFMLVCGWRNRQHHKHLFHALGSSSNVLVAEKGSTLAPGIAQCCSKTDKCPADWMAFQDLFKGNKCYLYSKLPELAVQMVILKRFSEHFEQMWNIQNFTPAITSHFCPQPSSDLQPSSASRWGFPGGLAEHLDGRPLPAGGLCLAGPGRWSAPPGRGLPGDPSAVRDRTRDRRPGRCLVNLREIIWKPSPNYSGLWMIYIYIYYNLPRDMRLLHQRWRVCKNYRLGVVVSKVNGNWKRPDRGRGQRGDLPRGSSKVKALFLK